MPACSVYLVQKPHEVLKNKVDLLGPFGEERSVKHAFPELDETAKWDTSLWGSHSNNSRFPNGC